MADKKIIAVLGSTGSQGGGLCRAILADAAGGFACRAVTRDTGKDKAKALASAGAQVVKGDLDDVESLKKAFAGAHGVYAVTNFWEHFSGEKEKAQAKNVADAAKAAGVKHVDLVDARGHPQVHEARRQAHADAAREVSRAALRRQGGSERVCSAACRPRSSSRRSIGTTSTCSASRRRRVTTASSRGRSRWAPRRWPASRPKTSARSPTASSRPATQYVGKTVGIMGEALTIEQMGQDVEQGARRRPREVQRRRGRRLSQLRLPGRRRDGQHVPGLSRLRQRDAREPQRRYRRAS